MMDTIPSERDYFHSNIPNFRYSNDRFKTSIYVSRSTWITFMQVCRERGQSTCHVLESLMEAWILGSSSHANPGQPITINMTFNYNVARPRRKPGVEIKGGLDPGTLRKMLAACKRLIIRDDQVGYVGWCTWRARHIRAGGCEGCPHQGEF